MTGSRRRVVAIAVAAAVGLVLAAAGVGTLLFGSPSQAGRVLGGNAPVDASALDQADGRANNSPTLVRDPRDEARLAVVNRIDTPVVGCALHLSTDGGATWEPAPLPAPVLDGVGRRCWMPDAAYGADGTLYVSFVTVPENDDRPDGAWVAATGSDGRAFSPPVRVAGPLAYQVRLVADPRQAGVLHLSWLQAQGVAPFWFTSDDNSIVVAASADGGRTWSPPARVSPPTRRRVVAPVPAVGPVGDLYLVYLDLGDDDLDYRGGHNGFGGDPWTGPWSLVLARSAGDGGSWQETVLDPAIVPAERIVVLAPPSPSVVVDARTGRVHVAFHDSRLGDADVWVWTSDAAGTFGPPARVNDTARHDGRAQYLPKLALAPDGRLDVVYYDRRADRRNVLDEVSLQSSTDGGRRFGPRVRLTDRPFDARVGPRASRGLPDLGDRLALLSGPHRALVVWTDTRGATSSSEKQDLARGVVGNPGGTSRHRWALSGVELAVVTVAGTAAVAGRRIRKASGKAQGRPSRSR